MRYLFFRHTADEAWMWRACRLIGESNVVRPAQAEDVKEMIQADKLVTHAEIAVEQALLAWKQGRKSNNFRRCASRRSSIPR